MSEVAMTDKPSDTPICDTEKQWVSWNGDELRAVCLEVAERLERDRAVLLAELKRLQKREYNSFEPNNQSESYNRICAAIAEVERPI